jgi:hypothetical protein
MDYSRRSGSATEKVEKKKSSRSFAQASGPAFRQSFLCCSTMLARVFRRPASTYSRKVSTAAATRETPRVSVKKSVVVAAVAAASLATLYYQSQQKVC